MSDRIQIVIEGPPVAKGRPRFVRGNVVTPAKTRSYEALIRHTAALAMREQNRLMLTGPVNLEVQAWFEIPASWSIAKRAQATLGKIKHTVRPDADNLLKVCDALNGVVWEDDKQIVRATVAKHYTSREPRLIILAEAA